MEIQLPHCPVRLALEFPKSDNPAGSGNEYAPFTAAPFLISFLAHSSSSMLCSAADSLCKSSSVSMQPVIASTYLPALISVSIRNRSRSIPASTDPGYGLQITSFPGSAAKQFNVTDSGSPQPNT